MTRAVPTGYFDLLEALAEEDCPVCTIVTRRVIRYLDAVNYEAALDPETLSQIIAARGWCAMHAEWWIDRANVLATASMYALLLAHLKPVIADISVARSMWRSGWLAGALDREQPVPPPDGVCPACDATRESERELLAALIESLADASFAGAYAEVNGLCLPHLSAALRLKMPEASAAMLKERAQRTAAQLHDELGVIIRHHDYRSQDEPVGAERNAQNRAVRWVSGSAATIWKRDPR